MTPFKPHVEWLITPHIGNDGMRKSVEKQKVHLGDMHLESIICFTFSSFSSLTKNLASREGECLKTDPLMTRFNTLKKKWEKCVVTTRAKVESLL